MYRVSKRDGVVVDFNVTKISAAIEKAFIACNKQYHPSVIDMLALRVTSDFEEKIKDDVISVEDIQDSPKQVLQMLQRLTSFTEKIVRRSVTSEMRCSTIRTSLITICRSTTGV